MQVGNPSALALRQAQGPQAVGRTVKKSQNSERITQNILTKKKN